MPPGNKASPKKASPAPRKSKKIALGKGINALIPTFALDRPGPPAAAGECAIELIQPNRYQPRRHFAAEELEELAQSIRSQGVIQPLIVRRSDDGYELIAGERRLRAAKLAGLEKVPIVVRDADDAEMLEMSLVENVQRANLNPIEEAEAYHQLMTRSALTQDQVAERVGKSRSAVANFLRLRHLPETIKADIGEGTLSMGHARALLAAATPALQTAAWRTVVSKGLSVRETERLVKRLNTQRRRDPQKRVDGNDPYFTDLAENLSRRFGTKVIIKREGEKGRVEIAFFSFDDLDRLLTLLR